MTIDNSNLDNDLARVCELDQRVSGKFMTNLSAAIDELRRELPLPAVLSRDSKKWWTQSGDAWIRRFRAIIIRYRNIGHDWQFSEEQKALLQQYYDANRLLVDCLNSDCYVSRDVRQEIEETLLLPIAEIERRQQENSDRR